MKKIIIIFFMVFTIQLTAIKEAFACNLPIPLIYGESYYEMWGCEASTTFYFDGSDSYDYLGNPVFCEWSFPDGAISVNVWGEYNEYASCRFNAPGTYYVRLDVVDEEGTYSDPCNPAICVVYVSPGRCNNCRSFSDTFYECYHEAGWVLCAYQMCIMNVVSTSTCDFHDNSNCPSTCTTSEIVGPDIPPEYRKYKINLDYPNCPTGGQLIQYQNLWTIHQGCPSCTHIEALGACLITSCQGDIVDWINGPTIQKSCSGICQF